MKELQERLNKLVELNKGSNGRYDNHIAQTKLEIERNKYLIQKETRRAQ